MAGAVNDTGKVSLARRRGESAAGPGVQRAAAGSQGASTAARTALRGPPRPPVGRRGCTGVLALRPPSGGAHGRHDAALFHCRSVRRNRGVAAIGRGARRVAQKGKGAVALDDVRSRLQGRRLGVPLQQLCDRSDLLRVRGLLRKFGLPRARAHVRFLPRWARWVLRLR